MSILMKSCFNYAIKEILFVVSLLLLGGIEATVNPRFYPRYHLAPPYGWMNDPNGFCVYKNEYHLFYQFNPNSSLEPGIANWGHAKSKDLFHWEHLPIALFPDQSYDDVGAFSGSAIVEDGNMYLFYTGNGKTQQTQELALSNDGYHIFKYQQNPIIIGEARQPNFRDPKVWKHKGTYYMVLGNSFVKHNKRYGRVLLYKSKDKYNWCEVAILAESDGFLGYMYECPDFFEIDGKFILMFSPQGVEPQGDSYKNLYQTGYIVGNFDYRTKKFKPITPFIELDHGHDFYATQSIEDNVGRRIVIAWLDMWETNYAEAKDGFTGQMTIPRTLTLSKNNSLLQKPVSEISTIRDKTLYKGSNKTKVKVALIDKIGEILVTAKRGTSFDVVIKSNDSSATATLSYDSASQYVSLNRGGKDGVRRAKWIPKGNIKWQIFVDASSIELFCGDGELTFSSRFFPKTDISVSLISTTPVNSFIVNALQRSVPYVCGI
ncbi:unnamed protein product [Diatraea saccharalis]|uniref:Sucrose-6-phosphate hydrolase n=1 Tax=Diatraea saccharalis TaxID=40085 RepID=A0A9N9R8H2_9NEOP|nr:unnamed protein product [Diatraea saccharalis]